MLLINYLIHVTGVFRLVQIASSSNVMNGPMGKNFTGVTDEKLCLFKNQQRAVKEIFLEIYGKGTPKGEYYMATPCKQCDQKSLAIVHPLVNTAFKMNAWDPRQPVSGL